jgi:protoporphyrinogen oxidase
MTFNLNNAPPRVVVLGGGAAGMTAAWELRRLGAEVTVVEREPLVGGLCATHERDGWRFDLGGHRFLSRSGELVELVQRLLGDELLDRQRRSVILLGGRQYRYPLDAGDLARNLPFVEGLRSLASWARQRLRTHGADITFEDYVVRRFGRRLYEQFFGPYTEKLWGLPPTGLAADWAAERIAGLDLGAALVRLLGLGRGRPRSYARGYFYPRLGIGRIFERMHEDLGAAVITGVSVDGLERDRRGAIAEVRCSDGRVLPCDFVVSTMSLPALAQMLRPSDGEVTRHAERLRYRAVRFLNILLDRPQVTPNTWMYVSEPRFLPTRIQEPRHRSPFMAPAGRTSLMLEIPCNAGDDVWRAGDEPLLARCLEDLSRLGVPALADLRPSVRGCFSTRVAEGYPVYAVGFDQHRSALFSVAATAPNLVTIGRQGTFRYLFMDIAMEMGLAAARQIAGGRIAPRTFVEFRHDRQLLEAQSVTA